MEFTECDDNADRKEGNFTFSSVSMKKAQSVDFSRFLGKSTSLQCIDGSLVASQFSLRAARGRYCKNSMSELNSEISCGKDFDQCNANLWEEKADNQLSRSESWSDNATDAEMDNSFVVRFSFPRFSLAKLSVVILALATVTDHVLSRMSPDKVQPRSSLGSAAISSLTETFSPILPFTGGLDLRRDDYWQSSGNWLQTIQSVAIQIKDAFSEAPQVQSLDQQSNFSGFVSISRQSASLPVHATLAKVNHEMALSSSVPFVPVMDIADLTLGEVGETLRYAIESGREDFDRNVFLSASLPRVRNVLDAFDSAVLRSRGNFFKECKTSPDEASGEVDALKFAAALRVFGEWRMPRQIPDGYKGFAVGMSLGHKDVVQNLAKIEQAVHSWQDYRSNSQGEKCGPTLRQLLQHELDLGVHGNLPRLKDKTGAMGLLWVRRQLQYQSNIFDNLLAPEKFASAEEGLTAAYTEVYGKFHGWAVQKIFSYSFQAAPKPEEIFVQMNPHKLKELISTGRQGSPSVVSFDGRNHVAETPIADESNPIEAIVRKVAQDWDNLASHVGKEWDNFASNVVKTFNKNHVTSTDDADVSQNSSSQPVDDNFVAEEMGKDAREQITLFLDDASPMLDYLSKLFVDMNMDDPTKV